MVARPKSNCSYLICIVYLDMRIDDIMKMHSLEEEEIKKGDSNDIIAGSFF